MKYSSTTRLINVVVFALLFVVFGAAAIYFGFFVCPDFFAASHFSSQFTQIGVEQAGYFSDFSFLFPAAIAVVSLAVAAVSALGLVNSIRSVLNERNDEIVVKSFLGYVSVAYILAVFFLINALLFYNVYGKGVTGWWIVICVILTIAALIGGNVPMMKLLEDQNPNHLVALIFNVMGVIGCSIAAVLCLPTIATLTSNQVVYNLPLKLACACGVGLVVGVLGFVAGKLANKNIAANKESALPTVLGMGGLLVSGLYFIGAATYNAVYNGHHNSCDKIWGNNWDLVLTKGAGIASNNKVPTDFVVMAYIVGIALVAAAVAFLVYSMVGDKKKAAK